MNTNEELAPLLPRWQPIGRRPTSESVLAFLRALAQYMLNITTKENTDGMGLAGCVMEDAKYQAKSANHAPYVEPPDPVATHPDAIIRYHASDMILYVHSDASYLSEPKARSRLGGHFYLSTKQQDPFKTPNPTDPIPPNNGAIKNNSTIMKCVLASAAEAEYGAVFFNMGDAVPIRKTLEEMGHPQPPTHIITNNSTAVSLANKTVKQRRSKAVDMRFYWVQDRVLQKQFLVYWRKGANNLADYMTKHFPARYHIVQQPNYLLKSLNPRSDELRIASFYVLK